MEIKSKESGKHLDALEIKKKEIELIIEAQKKFYIENSQFEFLSRLRDSELEMVEVFKKLKNFVNPSEYSKYLVD